MDDHKSIYIKNAVWLAILTLLEVGVAFLSISRMGQIALLFAFAATKMMMVAMIYMHLRYETKFLRRSLLVPIPLAVFFLWGVVYDLSFNWTTM